MPALPFTGRQAELRFLREQLHLTGEHGTRFILLMAPAGMGKTALVRRFLESVKDICTGAEGGA